MPRLAPDFEKRARDLMALYPKPRSALLPLCHLAQEQDGHLSAEAMAHIGELLGITPAEVLSVASFYDMFHTEPVGTYVIGICTNIACLLNGGEELLHHAEKSLGIRHGDTTRDGTFTLEELECIAHCDKAPCLQVNHRYFGPLTAEGFDTLCAELRAGRHKATVPPHGTLIRVKRDGGLRVPPDQISAERAAMAQAQADRAEAADAEAARAEVGEAEAARAEVGDTETARPGAREAEARETEAHERAEQQAEGEVQRGGADMPEKAATPVGVDDIEDKTAGTSEPSPRRPAGGDHKAGA